MIFSLTKSKKNRWLINGLFYALFFLLGGVSWSISAQSFDNEVLKVERLYQQTITLDEKKQVLALAEKIIPLRKRFSTTVVAKTYVLLSELAMLDGEVHKAIQFAEDGLSTSLIDENVKARLLLTIASGKYIQKKYRETISKTNQLLMIIDRRKPSEIYLSALSYRAMSHALLSNYQQALFDIDQIQSLLRELNNSFHHINIIEIIAAANHSLGNYQTALDLYLKILKLRFQYKKTENIEQLYFKIANEYRLLGQLDDAYNAYWEAKRFGIKKSDDIQIHIAELGLAELSFLQGNYQNSFNALVKLQKVFKTKQRPKIYLNILIALSHSAAALNKKLLSYQLLTEAENLLAKVEPDDDHIVLYQLLAKKYEYQGEFKTAYDFLAKYLKRKQRIERKKRIIEQFKHSARTTEEKSHAIGVQIATGGLQKNISDQLTQQRWIIESLGALVLILVVIIFYLRIKIKNNNMKQEFFILDQPNDYIAPPRLARKIYQHEFIKARKYQYPFPVVYLRVTNWKDIQYHFRKKEVKEVQLTLATIINAHLSEFDQVGCLNDGEYILQFPHQTESTVNSIVTTIVEAIHGHLFANLGKFSVIVQYSFAIPDAQDLDPFVFLSSLTNKPIQPQISSKDK